MVNQRSQVRRLAFAAAALMIASGALAVVTPAVDATTATTVTLTASPNPSAYGQSVAIRATASDPATPVAQLTGSVTILDGSAALVTRAAVNGKASLSTTKLTPGDHSLTAVYAQGTAAETVSAPVVQHVNPGHTTLTLSSSNPAVYVGQTANVTAAVQRVAPAPAVPQGTVDFSDDGYSFASVSLNAVGKAVLPVSSLSPGVHTLTATYTGSDAYDPSTGPTALTQTILVNVPVAGATFTPNTVSPGAATKLVVSATNTGPTALNGNVALGVLTSLPATSITPPAGAICGARPGLYYCLISVPKGTTRSITLTMNAPGLPGSYSVNSYARNIDTGDETSATATLTVG